MFVYVDTNVYIDFLTQRKYHVFFERALACKYDIVISDLIVKEITYQKCIITDLISWLTFARKIYWVYTDNDDKKQAYRYKTHFNDALHIILAQKYGVNAIITSNIKDFTEAKVSLIHPNDVK